MIALGRRRVILNLYQLIFITFKIKNMGFDQYHEPAEELSAATRTFARMVTSLIEEAEAIGWYEQRISVEKDKQAKAIMQNAQQEEFKHFGMDLEFLLRKKPDWRTILKSVLFTTGDIVKLAKKVKRRLTNINITYTCHYVFLQS